MSAARVVVGAGLGVGLLALMASPRARQGVGAAAREVGTVASQALDDAGAWVGRVIGRVSRHEGRHDSLNLNTDGAGLSFGILQWVQKAGTLGLLLSEMYRVDPGRFVGIFGPGWEGLLRATGAGSLAPVEGSVLWTEPWVGRFRSAGRDPVFQAVQDRMAATGEHFQGAVEAVRVLGIPTERAVALMYDTSVQQGPGFARKLARTVRQLYAGRSASVKAILTTFAALAPAHFRRVEAPTGPYPVNHIEWRAVGTEWHAFAGRIDLYEDVLRRRMSIVEDPQLGDTPLALMGGA